MGSLLLGTISDSGPQANDRRLTLLLASFSDGVVDRREVAIKKGKYMAAYSQYLLTYLHCRHGELASRKKGSVAPRSQ